MTDIVRSWQGGPLRPNKSMYELWAYICDRCRQSARTGVRLRDSEWLCASCERGHVRGDLGGSGQFGVKGRSRQGPVSCLAGTDDSSTT
jgi:hypothetical protein